MFLNRITYNTSSDAFTKDCQVNRHLTGFLVALCIMVLPTSGYAIDYQGRVSGTDLVSPQFSSGGAKNSQQFGDHCAHHLRGNYNFARNLKQRKHVDYAGTDTPEAAFVIGFSIALGPDTVIRDSANRLRFDMANTDTMNGPLSGFAAYRDCQTQNMLQGLR
jgi:hypothetical protein